jgi:hypothetical protein
MSDHQDVTNVTRNALHSSLTDWRKAAIMELARIAVERNLPFDEYVRRLEGLYELRKTGE